jgi:hypothetical protein
MASRLELQSLFEEILGSKNVYYQPPSNLNMKYDCIRYSLDGIHTDQADDMNYLRTRRYNVMVISTKPDPEVVDKILDLPHSSLGRPYPADNLYHYPITLYY